jgi:hypothetical protein
VIKPTVLSVVVVGSPKVRGTAVSITLACTGPAGARCQGRALLTATEKLLGTKIIAITSAKRHTRAVTVGQTLFAIAAGKRKTITVKLNRTGLALLTRFHTLRLKLTTPLTKNAKSVAFKTIVFKQTRRARR